MSDLKTRSPYAFIALPSKTSHGVESGLKSSMRQSAIEKTSHGIAVRIPLTEIVANSHSSTYGFTVISRFSLVQDLTVLQHPDCNDVLHVKVPNLLAAVNAQRR